jgi:Ca-activated chloride channel family protein
MRKLLSCVAAGVILTVAALVWAQTPPTPQQTPPAAQQPANQPPTGQQGDIIIKAKVERVPVLFTAVDRRDHFVTDLERPDVQVFDEKKKQEIVDFTQETDLPLRVGLLVDTSNSIRDRFKFEQEAAIEFLRSIIRQGKDEVFLMSYDTNVELVQDLTGDIDALTKGIRSLKAGGGTSLYDAIYEASRDKFLHSGDSDSVSVRRVLIVIGDGDDNNSRASREETLAMAQRAEATVFTIGTNISGVEMTGDKILKRFSEETGGRSFFPFHLQDMTTSFQNITLELRSQYSLVFKPSTPRDGQFHHIEVASLRKGVKVRARKGYFATSQ